MKTSILLMIGVLAPALCLSAADAKSSGINGGAQTALEVGGVKVTLAEFEQARPMALFQARNALYQAQTKALETYADELLLEQAAKRENLTVAQLLERHVNGALPKDPSDDALKIFLEGVDTSESFESLKGRLLDTLRQRRIVKIRNAYMASLRAEAKVAIRLAPPRAEVPLANSPVRGSRNAPVTFVEYADYECPYCQQVQPVLEKLQTEYRDKMAFVYKDVPLPMHASAQKAAEAAQCAGDQGKYWEFHDSIVLGKGLDVPSLKEVARTQKLDTARFNKCLDGGEKAGVIKASTAEWQSLGMEGTPSFLINGRFFSGSLTYEALRAVVEEELAGKGVAKTAAAR